MHLPKQMQLIIKPIRIPNRKLNFTIVQYRLWRYVIVTLKADAIPFIEPYLTFVSALINSPNRNISSTIGPENMALFLDILGRRLCIAPKYNTYRNTILLGHYGHDNKHCLNEERVLDGPIINGGNFAKLSHILIPSAFNLVRWELKSKEASVVKCLLGSLLNIVSGTNDAVRTAACKTIAEHLVSFIEVGTVTVICSLILFFKLYTSESCKL